MRSLDSTHEPFRNKWQSGRRGSAGLDGFTERARVAMSNPFQYRLRKCSTL